MKSYCYNGENMFDDKRFWKSWGKAGLAATFAGVVSVYVLDKSPEDAFKLLGGAILLGFPAGYFRGVSAGHAACERHVENRQTKAASSSPTPPL